jgi:hypothetical protein
MMYWSYVWNKLVGICGIGTSLLSVPHGINLQHRVRGFTEVVLFFALRGGCGSVTSEGSIGWFVRNCWTVWHMYVTWFQNYDFFGKYYILWKVTGPQGLCKLHKFCPKVFAAGVQCVTSAFGVDPCRMLRIIQCFGKHCSCHLHGM